jgi:GT2 family glycosyltransferase
MNVANHAVPTTLAPSGVPAPQISVVLVCWNNRPYLEGCLDSLYRSGLSYPFEVIVVDNGSSDGSQQMLAARFPEVALVQNPGNVGLSRASNQGIAIARGPYVLLLNNDTLVDGPSLDAMVECLDRHPEAAAAGGRLLNSDGSFQCGYAKFSTLWEEFLIGTRVGELLWKGYPSHGDCAEPKPVGWLSSACLLLRESALDAVGVLDEEYFIYGDEADLQFRLKKAGWLVYYLPEAQTIHYGGRSLDRWRRRHMVYRGKLMFYRKNYGRFRSAALRLMFASLSLAKALAWAPLSLKPGARERARKELRSNLDVVKVCLKLA